ncbi:MAG: hypothetical protein RIR70_177, partial [Pseudomonadota bacterium]
LVVSASDEALAKMRGGFTRAVVNAAQTPTADFAANPDWQFPRDKMEAAIADATSGHCRFVDAQHLATQLMGDAIATNLFMLGFAWQEGLVPVSLEALHQAIELNGVAIEMNKAALHWGRRASHDLAAVQSLIDGKTAEPPRTLDELIARRVAFLTDYQDAAYAARYADTLAHVRAAEARLNSTALTEAAAQSLFKLMAYKDEYEVARLYTAPTFRAQIAAAFEGDYTLNFHLAPPLFAERDALTGVPKKRAYGPWMMKVFGLLSKLKGLRGTRWDVFGYTAERQMERALITQFEADLARVIGSLDHAHLDTAIALAKLPQEIRGFGHVKLGNVEKAAKKREQLLLALNLADGA